jgi:hypothetical protein
MLTRTVKQSPRVGSHLTTDELLPGPAVLRSGPPLPSSSGLGEQDSGPGSPAVLVWLIAPCSMDGLGGVATGTVGA